MRTLTGRIRRRRGMTLTEVALGASISTFVLITGVGLFLTGMRSWIKGQASIDALSATQKAARMVSNELRQAMEVTVSSDGTQVAYKLPARDGQGNFVSPMTYDGVPRSFSVSNGVLTVRADDTDRTICRNLLAGTVGQPYRFFSTASATTTRSLTIQFIAGKPGVRGESVVSRVRETVYLRNVPQLSR